MLNFDVGALRPAKDGARPANLSAANDLVRRTLAQHGLLPDQPAGATTSLATTGLPFANLPLGPGIVPAQPLPEGASFTSETFTCPSGSRDYMCYVPASAARGIGTGATGLVVMLHGCTQTPQDFATGTGMNALADEHGFVVVYPRQSRGDNAQSCWTWFSRGNQARGRGEPAILAGIAQHIAGAHDVTPARTFVAGLSAGAAMAVILGETYPDVFAAVGAHSGLPFGAAADVASAFAAMGGRITDRAAGARTQSSTRTIIFHGTSDATVHPSNADRITRDALDRGGAQTVESVQSDASSGRAVERRIVADASGSVTLEQWRIEGLGHAWSGGRPGGSYTDPTGPDASREMVRFFFEQGTERP